VVVVALDQKSINFYRRKMQVGWPWPRSFYQILVDYLAQGGARAVLFDMYFSEPSSDSKESDGAEVDAEFGAAIARAERFISLRRCSPTPMPSRTTTSGPRRACCGRRKPICHASWCVSHAILPLAYCKPERLDWAW